MKKFILIADLAPSTIEPFESMLDFDDAIDEKLPSELELDGSEQEKDALKVFVYADDDGKSIQALRQVLGQLVGADKVIDIKARAY